MAAGKVGEGSGDADGEEIKESMGTRTREETEDEQRLEEGDMNVDRASNST